MDKSATLGERIYKYRTEMGLSQLELSELLDVSRQSISKWETDVAVPELSKKKHIILAIVTALALPLKHLALWLLQIFWFEVVANGDAEYYARVIAMNYRALIPTLEFIVDLAFTVTFTACLVPTFYWLRGLVNNRNAEKLS